MTACALSARQVPHQAPQQQVPHQAPQQAIPPPAPPASALATKMHVGAPTRHLARGDGMGAQALLGDQCARTRIRRGGQRRRHPPYRQHGQTEPEARQRAVAVVCSSMTPMIGGADRTTAGRSHGKLTRRARNRRRP